MARASASFIGAIMRSRRHPAPCRPIGGPSQNGEARRTLHLSLSQANGRPGGDSHSPHAQNAVNPAHGSDNRPAARPQGGQPGFAQQPRQAAGPALPFGPPPSPMGAVRGPATAPSDAQRAREGGAFIDHALRERIDGDIAAFLAAFDAALDHDTAESRTGLREATDRLLRAGARTRIELERLEARVPLARATRTRSVRRCSGRGEFSLGRIFRFGLSIGPALRVGEQR